MNEERMQLTEQELEEFDRLYNGDLEEGDRYRTMARIQADADLQRKYARYSEFREELLRTHIQNQLLKDRFAALDRRLRRKRMFGGLGVLAVVSLLGAFLYFNWNQPATGAELYERYADSEAGLAITMDDGDSDAMNRAMITLAQGKYREALVLFQEVQAPDTAQYYRAYCQERLGADSSARVLYVALQDAESVTIRDKSRFRAALLHLKADDPRARQALQAIADDPSNGYRALAKEILRELKAES